MVSYGMNPVDLFEANDLFESGNITQVQVALLALAGKVRLEGTAVGGLCVEALRFLGLHLVLSSPEAPAPPSFGQRHSLVPGQPRGPTVLDLLQADTGPADVSSVSRSRWSGS